MASHTLKETRSRNAKRQERQRQRQRHRNTSCLIRRCCNRVDKKACCKHRIRGQHKEWRSCCSLQRNSCAVQRAAIRNQEDWRTRDDQGRMTDWTDRIGGLTNWRNDDQHGGFYKESPRTTHTNNTKVSTTHSFSVQDGYFPQKPIGKRQK